MKNCTPGHKYQCEHANCQDCHCQCDGENHGKAIKKIEKHQKLQDNTYMINSKKIKNIKEKKYRGFLIEVRLNDDVCLDEMHNKGKYHVYTEGADFCVGEYNTIEEAIEDAKKEIDYFINYKEAKK